MLVSLDSSGIRRLPKSDLIPNQQHKTITSTPAQSDLRLLHMYARTHVHTHTHTHTL